MTTIAYRDGIMAADSAAFADDTYGGSCVKVFRTKSGGLAAFCGSMIFSAAIQAWLQSGEGSKPAYGTDVTGILVEADGAIWVVNGDGDRAQLNAPYVASGSGRIAALGAMAAGASAERAVEIACELDAYTRGPVQMERLGKS